MFARKRIGKGSALTRVASSDEQFVILAERPLGPTGNTAGKVEDALRRITHSLCAATFAANCLVRPGTAAVTTAAEAAPGTLQTLVARRVWA